MNTVGAQTLSVTFTPTDTTLYTAASATVTIQVNASGGGGGGGFVGPANGGGWSGTLVGTTFTYNGQDYTVVNGVVTFPDCSTYYVSVRGSLFAGAPPAVGCTPSR